MQTIQDLTNDMKAYGLILHSSNIKINSTTIQRCPTADKPRSKNGWYRVWEENDFITAVYGDHQIGETIKWCSKTKLSPYDRQLLRQDRYKASIVENTTKEDAILHLHEQYKQFPLINEAISHQYLINKGLNEWLVMGILHPLRINVGNLIIPIYNVNNEFRGYQSIGANGYKQFAAKSDISGNFHTIIREELTINECDVIYVGEGLGNMITTYIGLNEATSAHFACIVAFSVHNIEPVLLNIWSQSPSVPVRLIADNDRDKERNIGVETCQRIRAKYKNKTINLFIPEEGVQTL